MEHSEQRMGETDAYVELNIALAALDQALSVLDSDHPLHDRLDALTRAIERIQNQLA